MVSVAYLALVREGRPEGSRTSAILVETAGLVEGTGERATHTGGRPAELVPFPREVQRKRPAPDVGLPGTRRRG